MKSPKLNLYNLQAASILPDRNQLTHQGKVMALGGRKNNLQNKRICSYWTNQYLKEHHLKLGRDSQSQAGGCVPVIIVTSRPATSCQNISQIQSIWQLRKNNSDASTFIIHFLKNRCQLRTNSEPSGRTFMIISRQFRAASGHWDRTCFGRS